MDTILEKSIVNQEVYEFVIDFLVTGFESIGFEKGLEHIADHNQLDRFCVNTERKKELEKRMDLLKKLAIGQPAPGFVLKDINGNDIQLKDIPAKRTVLLFWSSWCPHCDELLPILHELYEERGRDALEVIAISVDEDGEAYKKALDEKKYNWINMAELMGWDGPVVMAYGIAATPSLIVLDENKTIIGKPVRLDTLEQLISE